MKHAVDYVELNLPMKVHGGLVEHRVVLAHKLKANALR